VGPSLFCGPDINRLVLPTAEEEEEATGPVADDVGAPVSRLRTEAAKCRSGSNSALALAQVRHDGSREVAKSWRGDGAEN